MKRIILCILALTLLLTVLSGCGGASSEAGKSIDLQAFLEETESNYELGAITALDDELLVSFYPGLGDIETLQRVAYMPMITGRVSEYIFLQCADKADTETAAEILQARVDEQASGGAFYPESVEAWAKAKVIIRDDYVLLIASGDQTDSIAADFEALF